MTRTLMREPGTYRTASGVLVHSWASRDGVVVMEREDGALRDEVDLVKLSDDPTWPDVDRRLADPALLCD